jgi:hypothetical protein
MGVGYVLGRPDTRQKLIELARHPKAQELREQGQNLAAEGLHTAQRRLGRTSDREATPADGSPSTSSSAARHAKAPATADETSHTTTLPDPVSGGAASGAASTGLGGTLEANPTGVVTDLPPLHQPKPESSV